MYTLKSKYLVLKLVAHTQVFARTFCALHKVQIVFRPIPFTPTPAVTQQLPTAMGALCHPPYLRDGNLRMGWLRFVGSLKLYVSFAKDPYTTRLSSAKETYNLKEPTNRSYGVASISKINRIVGLFCKRALCQRLYCAKETCYFIDPTNRSHPIAHIWHGILRIWHETLHV